MESLSISPSSSSSSSLTSKQSESVITSTTAVAVSPDEFTESIAWTLQTEISANQVMEKEKIVREILATQDGLRALLSRVTNVKEECSKAEADNEMLQTYIDSVTKSLAAKERG